jgi:hypothetical protein
LHSLNTCPVCLLKNSKRCSTSWMTCAGKHRNFSDRSVGRWLSVPAGINRRGVLHPWRYVGSANEPRAGIRV